MFSADDVSTRIEPPATETAAAIRPARTPISRAAWRRSALRAALAAVYLASLARFGAGGTVHWVTAAIFVATPLAGPRLRGWLRGALPFALFLAAYDVLGLARAAVVARGVNVHWPYWLDKTVFGVGSCSERLSLNELFARHHWAAVDLVTGFAYFSYIYAVIGFVIYLALRDRTRAGTRRIHAVGWTFFGVNAASFVTYLAFPVAPPWYVAARGFGPADVNAVGNPGALARLDAWTGIPYFQRFYAHATDVFGSMPSMHCAYPMLLLLFAVELRRRWLIVTLATFQVLMAFSAVYLQHHYVPDVIAGTLYAIAGYLCERALTGRCAPAGQQRSNGQTAPERRWNGAGATVI
jgi:membrane-associated phospholipid phosphatase